MVDCYLPAPLLGTMWMGTLRAASVEEIEDDDKRGSSKQFGWKTFWKTGKNVLARNAIKSFIQITSLSNTYKILIL